MIHEAQFTLNRRQFFGQSGLRMGGIAMPLILGQSLSGRASAASEVHPALPGLPHAAAKAKAVIYLHMNGGPSQLDTWDYKPELAKRNGTPFDPDGKLQFFASKPGNCQGSYWKFRQHGACGRWMSDLFPRLATCVDDMAFVHSMHSLSLIHS